MLLLCISAPARLAPSLSFRRLRPLLKFGFQFQAVAVSNLARDMGTNVVIAVMLGVSALGVWSIAYRILQIPFLVLASLWRVSYPAMSRLVAAREDVGPTIERVAAVAAVASGLVLVPLVAVTPAWVPTLLGAQWEDAVPVIPPASLHLMIIGPISTALMGYLWAVGDAAAVLRATLVGIPLMYAVMVPLLAVIGVPAVGFGWLGSCVGEVFILISSGRRDPHASNSGSASFPPCSLQYAPHRQVGCVHQSPAASLAVSSVECSRLRGSSSRCGYGTGLLYDSARMAMRGARSVFKPSASPSQS